MRDEDPRFLRGEACFLDDIDPREAVHVAFLRSAYAHADLVGLDVDDALGVDGLIAIYAFDDLPQRLREPLPVVAVHPGIRALRTPFCLADTKVRYAGEPVVMVVARDRAIAEDVVERIRVDYDPKPVVFNLETSVMGSHPVHENVPDNCAGEVGWTVGDPDTAIATAPHVFEFRWLIERSAAVPMEGRGVVAEWDLQRDRLLMHTSTQVPSGVRTAVASLLDVPERDVTVRTPDVGGAFGLKGMHPWPEELLVPWAARRLGVPVKWVEDRRENFIGSFHERAQQQQVRVGVDDDGRILGIEFDIAHEAGAYVPYGFIVPGNTATHLMGPYSIPNGRARVASYFTNAVPTAPYRGAGRPQAAFCIERTMDAIAHRLGLDANDVRRVNLLADLAAPTEIARLDDGTPLVYDSGSFTSAFEDFLASDEWAELRALRDAGPGARRLRGLGLACFVEGSGIGPYEGARLRVETSGTISATTGLSTQGQGHETTFAGIVSDVLSVPRSQVVVTTGDTDQMSYSVGTFASRSTVMAGSAMLLAARGLREKILRVAADLFEADVVDLELTDGGVQVIGVPERRVTLGDLAVLSNPVRDHYRDRREAGERLAGDLRRRGASRWWNERPGLEEETFFHQEKSTFGNGVQGMLLEVDVDTCEVRVLRSLVMHDCGVVLQPEIVEGQVIGAVAQGVAGALLERMHYDEHGQLQNASFMDFLMPYSTEVPPVSILHLETPSPNNPLGVKGAGEAGVIAASAAIASALEDAIGVQVSSVPISPDDVWSMLTDRGRDQRPRNPISGGDVR